MKLFFYLITLCFLFGNCKTQENKKTITTKELKELLAKEKIQLVDVRTLKEVKQGIIKNALFIDYFDADFSKKIKKKLKKDKPVYLYCRSGNRSVKACKILQEKGYQAYSVLGGYNQWKKEYSN